MNIVKRLPSYLAQYVFSFDDTFSNIHRIVITQLIYFNLFHSNKKHGIRKGLQQTNTHFDIHRINVFRKELPDLFTTSADADKVYNPSSFVMFAQYRDYLSFKKYNCVNHASEFRSNDKYYYDRLMVFALILNGHPYTFRYDREPVLFINAHFTTYRKHMYRDYLHKKKCSCYQSHKFSSY